MIYLVTGGCGFIGSHLCDALIANGHQVRVLDDLSSGTVDNLNDKAELILGDVANPAIVKAAMAGVDGCFHLAAVPSVERSVRDCKVLLMCLMRHGLSQVGNLYPWSTHRRLQSMVITPRYH